MSKELKDQISIEVENLDRLMAEMKELLSKTNKEKNFMEIRAAGSILHDFYSGIEKIFERPRNPYGVCELQVICQNDIYKFKLVY
ncbi:MAG: hypothetical protein HZA09_04480 [Nitrospirae bacterium]|nr:hypothetical protein [Nitrospirota bacterium]